MGASSGRLECGALNVDLGEEDALEDGPRGDLTGEMGPSLVSVVWGCSGDFPPAVCRLLSVSSLLEAQEARTAPPTFARNPNPTEGDFGETPSLSPPASAALGRANPTMRRNMAGWLC